MRRVLMLFVIAFALACRESDPVVATIEKIAGAAEDRDAAAVMRHLADDYRGRAQVEHELRRWFLLYRTIDVTIRELQTQRAGHTAAATFRVDFTGVPKTIGGIDELLPRTAHYLFDVNMREENGTWKIESARWTREE